MKKIYVKNRKENKVPFILKATVLLSFVAFATFINAQTTIGSCGTVGSSNAILDLNSGNSFNMGIIIPHVKLSATLTTFSPPMASSATTKDTGMMVYNINPSAGSGVGYYCWNGGTWVGVGGSSMSTPGMQWHIPVFNGTNSVTSSHIIDDSVDGILQIWDFSGTSPAIDVHNHITYGNEGQPSIDYCNRSLYAIGGVNPICWFDGSSPSGGNDIICLSYANANYAPISPSDIRLKENIRQTSAGISDLMKIDVDDYSFKSDKSHRTETGFIAQQLNDVFPIAVQIGGRDANTNPWKVDYGRVTPLIVKAVQDQQKMIEDQQKTIDDLKREIQIQQNKIDALSVDIQSLTSSIK